MKHHTMIQSSGVMLGSEKLHTLLLFQRAAQLNWFNLGTEKPAAAVWSWSERRVCMFSTRNVGRKRKTKELKFNLLGNAWAADSPAAPAPTRTSCQNVCSNYDMDRILSFQTFRDQGWTFTIHKPPKSNWFKTTRSKTTVCSTVPWINYQDKWNSFFLITSAPKHSRLTSFFVLGQI